MDEAWVLAWDGPQTVVRLRQTAWQVLRPGTLYEVRSTIPGDFGRARAEASLHVAVEETPLVPYVPGRSHPDLARGSVLYCRERVPEAAARDD